MSNSNNITITAGNSNHYIQIQPAPEEIIKKKFKPWKKIICWILGHKNISKEPLIIYKQENDKQYAKEFNSCERCGLYEESFVSYPKPLTEDEKIVKDIIT